MRHDDMEGRLCDFDNYQDLDHHVFHFCSETLIAKKLLVHTEKYLTSIGFCGVDELKNVQIPGLSNPFDPRCALHGNTPEKSIMENWVKHRRAMALESKSITDWVHAFDVCRAHHVANSGAKGIKERKNAANVANATLEGESRDQDLEEVIAASNALAEASKFVERLEYNLPAILRPLLTEAVETYEDYDSEPAWCLPDESRLFYGFQEAAITLVCRPVVSEDFYLDFERGYDMGAFPPLVRIVLLDFVIGCNDPDLAECVLSAADIVPLTSAGRQQRFYSVQSNCMDNYVRQDVFSTWKAGFVRHQAMMADRYAEGGAVEPWCLVKMQMEKSSFYAKQAIQFHCSNITDGLYRSDILTHILEAIPETNPRHYM